LLESMKPWSSTTRNGIVEAKISMQAVQKASRLHQNGI
jgi:hypothetical protein